MTTLAKIFTLFGVFLIALAFAEGSYVYSIFGGLLVGWNLGKVKI